MKIINKQHQPDNWVFAKDITVGTVFTGFISSKFEVFFKGIDTVVSLECGTCWSKEIDDERDWSLKIHDYKIYSDAALTL